MTGRAEKDPNVLYADCMEEIKRRTEVIQGFLRHEFHAKYVMTTAESIGLQLRKTLELIALASLVANRTEYEKYRANFHRDWNGKRILETLSKANPNFYPQPSKQVVNPETGKVESLKAVTTGYLSESDYVELYDICGAILHAYNPFSPMPNVQQFLDSVPAWLRKIMNLLNHHTVQLIDPDKQLWVLMHAQSDGKVHVYEFELVARLEDPERDQSKYVCRYCGQTQDISEMKAHIRTCLTTETA